MKHALALLALLLTLHAAAQDTPVFRAGAATSNITPPLGLMIAGSMKSSNGAYIHDELHVRCLVLDDGTDRLAFAVVDSCMIPREVVMDAKALIERELGIAPSNVLISATHTHSAACATPVFQSDPTPEYNAFLIRRIADGVTCANVNLVPARIGWGAANLPDQVFNRRWHMKEGTIPPNPFGGIDKVRMNPPRASADLLEPAGPTDPEISFISVQTPQGAPIALLANYSLHYVGGVGGGHISADYFAMVADRVQELLNADRQSPAFVGIMTNGTSGDINNINFREPGISQGPYEQMRIVANAVADAVHAAYSSIAYKNWVDLDATGQDLQLGVRKPTQDEVATAREVVAAVDGPIMNTYPEIYARETIMMSEYPDTVPVYVQALRLGDLAITAAPCEIFVEVGLSLKAKTPFAKNFTIELANGYNGYLPTPEQHALGGYETWRAQSSYLEVNASTAIHDTLLALMGDLKERP